MRSSTLPLALAFLVALFFGGPDATLAAPEGFHTLAIGDPAPDFSLPGVDDKTYTLADFKDAKLLMVVFTCNHCPTAQAYEQRIIDLHADYQGKGVALVAISPNDDKAVRLDELGYTDLGDSFDDMKERAKHRGFKFPYLYDGETQKASLDYGVVATPQVFLFDAGRKLRYVGRIDDSDVKEVKSHDARNALDALLAGKLVPVEKTRTFGCSTKWAEKRHEAEASLAKWNAEPVELKPIDEAALAKLAKNETDDLVLVNVWATYCGECIPELSTLVEINRMYRGRGFKVVTISLDDPEETAAALKVLKEKLVATENYISAIESRDKFADLLDKPWEGPLPHTVLIAPGGKVLYRETNAFNALALKRAIIDFQGRTYAGRPKR